MIRNTRQLAAARAAAAPLIAQVFTDDTGTTWRFWSLAPNPNTWWVTDGISFRLVQHGKLAGGCSTRTVEDVTAEHRAAMEVTFSGLLPALDDQMADMSRLMPDTGFSKARWEKAVAANRVEQVRSWQEILAALPQPAPAAVGRPAAVRAA